MEQSLMDKLTILADSANMMLPVPPAVLPGQQERAGSAAVTPRAAATPLLPMAAVSAC